MAPALKEWAVIVHALLEGEQVLDVRKGGLREDGRHFGLQATRVWLYPTAEHQQPELLKPAYRHMVDLAPASPVGGRGRERTSRQTSESVPAGAWSPGPRPRRWGSRSASTAGPTSSVWRR